MQNELEHSTNISNEEGLGFREIENQDTEESESEPAELESPEELDDLEKELQELVAEIEAAESVEDVEDLTQKGEQKLVVQLYERGELLAYKLMKAHNRIFATKLWPKPLREALLMDPPISSYADFAARRLNYPTLFRRVMIAKDVLIGAESVVLEKAASKLFSLIANFATKINGLRSRPETE